MELCVIASPTNPLAGRAGLRLHDLSRCQWIMPRADTSFYQRLEADFQRAGVPFPGSSIELSSPLVTKSIVRSTDLVAIVPVTSVVEELARRDLVLLEGDWSFGTRVVAVLHREGARPTHAGAALIEHIAKQGQRAFTSP
jgi:DNA-binding transcriptional LysR family regulator